MKPINSKAPVICRVKILINSHSVDVWKVLTDIEKWPSWQPDLKSTVVSGPVAAGTVFSWKTGGMKIKSELHAVEPYTLFGWTGKALGIYAIHNWTITELNNQTEILVEESMEGILARLLKPVLKNTLLKSNQTWLNSLKKECERFQSDKSK